MDYVFTVCECGETVRWRLTDIRGERWKHWRCPTRSVNDWPPDVIRRLVERERLRRN